ncbi:MAG: hypothetical protein Fur0024_5150 [Patescibacteria group bacterium]
MKKSILSFFGIYKLFFHIYILQGVEYGWHDYFKFFTKKPKYAKKFPEKTFRAKLTFLLVLFFAFLFFFFGTFFIFSNQNFNLKIFGGILIFLFLIFQISLFLNLPNFLILLVNFLIEIGLKFAEIYFMFHTKKLLSSLPDLKIVGIAGVYGKTSTKHFLKTLLEEDFLVLSTPKSFNTLLGVCQFVLKNLKRTHKILIIEIGGYKIGDVSKIAKIFSPDFSVITSTGTQHIDKYGSQENIALGDSEIIFETKKDGFLVLEKQFFDQKIVQNLDILQKFLKEKKVWVFGEKIESDFSFEILKTDFNGINFRIKNFKKEIFSGFVQLFSKEMISNLLGAILVWAKILKISWTEKEIFHLTKILKNIEPFERRFSVSQKNGKIFIDDSYNIGPESVKSAFVAVQNFGLKNLCIATGGIVDQIEFEKINFEFGKLIAENFKFAILTKNRFFKFIKNGILSSGKRIEIFEVLDNSERERKIEELEKNFDLILIQNGIFNEWM